MRTFMEENHGKKVPKDYGLLPGKLDHTTALSFKVGIKKKVWKASTPKRYEQLTNSDSSLEEIYDAIWDERFGDVFVMGWDGFIRGLGLNLTEHEENVLATIIDYSKAKSVTRYKFTEFLKGFGPLEHCVENVKRVVGAEWFHGFISANESKKFLEQQIAGTFLIRFSGSRPGSLVLDYVMQHSHVRSVRLTAHPGGGFAAPSAESQSKELVFKTLHELVETNTKNGVLRYPFSTNLTQKAWFYGDVTGDRKSVV